MKPSEKPQPEATRFVSVRVPVRIIDALEEEGRKHERNLSAEVRLALRRHVEQLREAA